MPKTDVDQYWESSIRNGSKSFSFGAQFFSEDQKRAAYQLYAWCRHCDDVIDDPQNISVTDKRLKLQELLQQTKLAFENQPGLKPAFEGLRQIAQKYKINQQHAEDLLMGMSWDIEGRTYETYEELLEYCYCVAGTVGLMMTTIMIRGAADQNALPCAKAMGQAMQLTNIARDILDDYAMGRVYLPRQWLHQEGLLASDLCDLKKRDALHRVAQRLLKQADQLYNKGDQGLRYLPFWSAAAVSVAREIYSAIGTIVLKQKLSAWENRAVVSKGRKIFLGLKGFLKAIFAHSIGPFIAITIFGSWFTTLAYGLLYRQWTTGNAPGNLLIILLLTFLNTGLFITAHDAMHGSICPAYQRFNHALGRMAAFAFAAFSYSPLLAKHRIHHANPTAALDPDFHGPGKPGFFSWLFRFIGQYMTWRQLLVLMVLGNIQIHIFGISELNMITFWIVPSLLSMVQLFYFGTYLPHREQGSEFTDYHCARSTGLSPLLSFMTCYHFGYHWEHHAFPATPWWKLSQIRKMAQKTPKKTHKDTHDQ